MLVARLLLLFAVVVWGATFVATKICLETLSPAQLVGARFLIALPMLFLIARASGVRIGPVPLRLPIVTGVAVFSFHYLVQTLALVFTTASNSGWLVAVTPLAIALLSAIFLRESIPRATSLGILVASLGVVLLISRGNLGNLDWLSSIGDWLALGSCFTWAAYTLITRELVRTTHPLAITILVHVPGAVLAGLVLVAAPSQLPLAELPLRGVVALGFLAIFGSALAQYFWQIGISRVGSVAAGMFLYLEPLATTALAVPVLGEVFGLASALGGALLLLGVYVAQRFA